MALQTRKDKIQPAKSNFLSELVFLILLLITAWPAIPSQAREPDPSVKASEIFRPGVIGLRLVPHSSNFFSEISSFGMSEPGINNSWVDDTKLTMIPLDIGIGTFIFPKFFLEIDFSSYLVHADPDYMICGYECNDFPFTIAFDIGGEISYLHPVTSRFYLNLGPELRVFFLLGNMDPQAHFQAGAHAGGGFFLTREIALNLGLFYQHVFNNLSANTLGWKADFRFFFPLTGNLSSNAGNPDDLLTQGTGHPFLSKTLALALNLTGISMGWRFLADDNGRGEEYSEGRKIHLGLGIGYFPVRAWLLEGNIDFNLYSNYLIDEASSIDRDVFDFDLELSHLPSLGRRWHLNFGLEGGVRSYYFHSSGASSLHGGKAGGHLGAGVLASRRISLEILPYYHRFFRIDSDQNLFGLKLRVLFLFPFMRK